MVRLALLAVFVSAVVVRSAAAQPATAVAGPENSNDPPGVGIKVSFRPSVAVVVGIFAMIFSLTFLLLMYAKFCHPSASSSPLPATLATTTTAAAAANATVQQVDQAAGVPKPVIESLPFFRFATLRGARKGMECVVCLARFDDADLLRLLPRCRHAFHLDCVDRWLETNASCPLCRAPVDADDATLGLKYAASARIVFGGDNDDDDDGSTAAGRSGRDLLDIFVERVPSSRFVGDDDPPLPPRQQQEADEEEQKLDRHRHRIIVSDAVFKSRWSELNSADLIALDTEMLRRSISFPSPDDPGYSNSKLSSPEDAAAREATTTEKKQLLGGNKQQKHGTSSSSSNVVVAGVRGSLSSGVRSVSEIVSLPRLRAPAREWLAEEDQNRRWLPIARRTARWFAGRAKQPREEDEGAVHVVAAHV